MSLAQIEIPTPETFPRTADAVVIGGGVVGAATAYWLSRAGLATVALERREALGTLTTAASAECFRAQFTEPAMMALARPSLEFFENFTERTGLPAESLSLHQQGYLFMTADPAQVPALEAAVKRYGGLGLDDVEFLAGAELSARFPFVSPRALAGAFRQRDGWLSANGLTYGYARASRAKFLLGTAVTGVPVAGGAVRGVQTDRGGIAAPVVVDAAGPFAARVARLAGVELPIETVRRQKAVLAAPDKVPPGAPMTIDVDNGSYWRPEAGGALVGWVDPDEPAAEPAESLAADWDFPALALERLRALTPFWGVVGEHLKSSDVHVSAGQYSYTPDDQPLLGPVEAVAGFHLNCGYWAGVMLSPEAGRWVAAMITGEMDPAQNPLRLSRYAEGALAAGGSLLRGRHSESRHE